MIQLREVENNSGALKNENTRGSNEISGRDGAGATDIDTDVGGNGGHKCSVLKVNE
jgi:hypothetical protein